eukprot:TRINITY_DN6474_c0_g1_i1.p1 TRINITY_DN6474_c0_g1~~TRINITY_DN6474_c0_g1_i1.p1  ORF type:complete len:413 (-),score=131.87 TRINITY_DN6474_c0_g1_i1:31-1269(-)
MKELSKMLVKDLKEELEKRGLSSKGLKAELLERLTEAVAKESQGSEDSSEQSNKPDEVVQKNEETSSPPEKQVSSPKKESQSSKTETKENQKVQEEKKSDAKVQDSQDKSQITDESSKKASGDRNESQLEMETGQDAKKRKSEDEKAPVNTPKRARKGWGSSTSESSSTVSTETLKDILPASAKQAHAPAKQTAPAPATSPSSTAAPKKESNFQVTRKESAAPSQTEDSGPREVAPPRKSPTNVVFIKNFVRPFTKKHVEELLSTKGAPKKWDMDSIKSKCYAIYEDVETATASRDHMHDLVWPAGNKTKLDADYITEEETAKLLSGETEPTRPAQRASGQAQRTSEAPPRVVEQQKKRAASPARSEPTPTTADALSQFFKKTQAKPSIYWLPIAKSDPAPTTSDGKEADRS